MLGIRGVGVCYMSLIRRTHKKSMYVWVWVCAYMPVCVFAVAHHSALSLICFISRGCLLCHFIVIFIIYYVCIYHASVSMSFVRPWTVTYKIQVPLNTMVLQSNVQILELQKRLLPLILFSALIEINKFMQWCVLLLLTSVTFWNVFSPPHHKIPALKWSWSLLENSPFSLGVSSNQINTYFN